MRLTQTGFVLFLISIGIGIHAQNALPNLRPPYAARPTDPYWQYEWHLDFRLTNGVKTNVDLNVRGAWEKTRGENVIVAIADDGVDLNHPDLATNAASALHYDFELDVKKGFHRTDADWHGTMGAGLIAAAQDGAGMVGIAPHVKFASWIVYPTNQLAGRSFITSDKMAHVYEYLNDTVQIQLHNWNETANFLRQIPVDDREVNAISNAVHFGRGGKGVVMVRPAGNLHFDQFNGFMGRNANDDGLTSDPQAIAVAAARADGRVASYSERGACILVAGLSGDDAFGFPNIFTTDRVGTAGKNQINFIDDPLLNNYVFDSLGFSGTSASTPMVAGICALILSANPDLTYRDVQQVLIHSSRHIDRADPDLRRNGAGYWVSHRLGFGIPDAGEAVRVAASWKNRPPAVRRQYASDILLPVPIPDASLGVQVSLQGSNEFFVGFPSYSVQPDDPTPVLPLVNVGLANGALPDLHGKGALVQRGVISFVDKINNVAAAGAAFAVLYNNVDSPPLTAMGNSDFMPIPTISISKTNGETLVSQIAAQPVQAQLRGTPAVAHFLVTDPMLCEHVGVRIRTTHPGRQDLRITLRSPSGTRSVLQAFNFDENPGPVDWTYYSTQHFYERALGIWTLEITDEVQDLTGNLTGADLIVEGTPIVDVDGDGLDDTWELANFGNLSQGALDDPDRDGSWNAREQAMGTKPTSNETPFVLTIANVQTNVLRAAFPSVQGSNYVIKSSTDLVHPATGGRVGDFGETETVFSKTEAMRFFSVEKP